MRKHGIQRKLTDVQNCPLTTTLRSVAEAHGPTSLPEWSAWRGCSAWRDRAAGTGSNVTESRQHTGGLGATALVLTDDEMERVGKQAARSRHSTGCTLSPHTERVG